jgi:hypothetical protein
MALLCQINKLPIVFVRLSDSTVLRVFKLPIRVPLAVLVTTPIALTNLFGAAERPTATL